MVALSFCLLLIAGALGGVLAARHLGTGVAPPSRTIGVVHGILGAVGLAALLLALRGPARGVALGVGSFGRIAAGLLVVALVAGLVILGMRWRDRRLPGAVIGVHATIAISGIVILAAYTLLG